MSRPAGFKIRHWTDDELDALRRLRELQRSWAEIGAAVGRSAKSAREKWFWVQNNA